MSRAPPGSSASQKWPRDAAPHARHSRRGAFRPASSSPAYCHLQVPARGLLFSGHVTVVPRTLEPFPVALTRRILISQENAVVRVWRELWSEERGQDVAEYAVMLAVILVIAVGTMQLIGVNASNVFSQIGSAIP